jgi:RNA polymerase sigma-70 factor (ECF subfamily)
VSSAEQDRLDPSVVAALYVEHGEELRRFVMAIVHDAQLASDVLQATFTKLIERGHTTQEESRKSWLFRVAYHEAIAYRRREGVGERILRRVAWQHNGACGAAEDPLVRWEAVQAVRKALEQLPAAQREVVRMRIYEEKTFASIAEELKIPLGTALGRMRAALEKLRAILRSPAADEKGSLEDE